MQVFSLLRPSQCCFTAILLLAASGLWLYNFLAPLPLCFGLPHSLSTYPSVVHSVQDAVLLHPSSLKSIGLPFGNEHFSPNFSLPLPSTVHSHRKRTLDFNTAVCTGQKLWKMIQDEYATPNPATSGRVFNYDDIDNGWTITHNAAIGPDGTWNTVFPSNPHFRYISMEQDRYFRNKFGKLTRDPQKDAKYSGYYADSPGIIIASNIRSPASEVMKHRPDISKEDLERSVPPLNRFSDVAFTVWSLVLGTDLANLRYLCHESVVNPDSVAIMHEIFINVRGNSVVLWPGVSFEMNTDEGKALLGTPNGFGTAWLLLNRYRQLGKRWPRVTIWTAQHMIEVFGTRMPIDGNYMLWELVDPRRMACVKLGMERRSNEFGSG